MHIVAVVNGDVISNADVDNRTRLFALSTGMPMTQDVLDRLKQQITRQLIDEKLRFQEVQRRKIVIPDKAIADCDPRYRGAQQPAGGRAAAKAQHERRRAADLGRPIAHPARLDPGAARAAWRPGEDHRCRGGRAAARAGAAGRQARVSCRRDFHSGRGSSRRRRRPALRRDRDQRVARRRALPGGGRAVQPEPDGAAGWRARLGTAEPARSGGRASGRRNAGRRDQQPGARCRAASRS